MHLWSSQLLFSGILTLIKSETRQIHLWQISCEFNWPSFNVNWFISLPHTISLGRFPLGDCCFLFVGSEFPKLWLHVELPPCSLSCTPTSLPAFSAFLAIFSWLCSPYFSPVFLASIAHPVYWFFFSSYMLHLIFSHRDRT